MNPKKIPYVSPELISYLRKSYPDEVPRYPAEHWELGRKAGEQGLIDFLENISKNQEPELHVRSHAQT